MAASSLAITASSWLWPSSRDFENFWSIKNYEGANQNNFKQLNLINKHFYIVTKSTKKVAPKKTVKKTVKKAVKKTVKKVAKKPVAKKTAKKKVGTRSKKWGPILPYNSFLIIRFEWLVLTFLYLSSNIMY